jgi:predicted RNase H-like HicB family nuclease
MEFTAVFMRAKSGYVGFVEELPLVNSHGATLGEARRLLLELVLLVFQEERRNAHELTSGREVVRESLVIPLPLAAPLRAAACDATESAP